LSEFLKDYAWQPAGVNDKVCVPCRFSLADSLVDRGIYAVLTARGRGHPLAQQFMDCLAHEVQMIAGSLLQAKKSKVG
jgi:hypothetical protein